MERPVPFGSPAALLKHNSTPKNYLPTTQDIAIVVCGGGDPMYEFDKARQLCEEAGKRYLTYVGNDQIAHFPHHVDHGGTLHPDKLYMWLGARREAGFEPIPRIWAHRNYTNTTDWTRDWQGSTGLFMAKVAREQGHTHVILCGVPMTVTAGHFVRNQPWEACGGFRRGWTSHYIETKPYFRSWSGWTKDLYTEPTLEWVETPIEDLNRLDSVRKGETA